MSYYNALAQALRNRKCSEEQVRDALATVHEAVTLSGASPENEFGPAKQYAESFTGARKHTPVSILRSLTLPIAIVAVVTLRTFTFPDIEFIPGGLLLGVGAFVGVWAVVEIIAALVNRRLPDGFDAPAATPVSERSSASPAA